MLMWRQREILKAQAVRQRAVVNNNRIRWAFEDGTLFQQNKRLIIDEVDGMLNLLGWTRLALAQKMNVQASAVTQSLAIDKGLQLTTLVRMADAMNCDIEVNFIRRSAVTIAMSVEM
jgi:hypothetical protein